MSRPVAKKIDALNERFIQVMERLGHTGYSLSRELGFSEAVISNIRLGKNPPNILLVQALLNKYEEVDPGWLLSGDGRMFRKEGRAGAKAIPTENGQDLLATMNDRLVRMENLLKRSVTVQLERDVLVDESISDLERQVADVERELKDVKKGRSNKP